MRAPDVALPDAGRLGAEFPPYRPLFSAPGMFVDSGHAELAALPVENGLIKAQTPGFLRPADALLLYELAWRAAGDVLEIGSAWGLSASVLAQAVRNAGRGARVVSVEIAPEFQCATRETVRTLNLEAYFEPRPGPAQKVMRQLRMQGRLFSVAFVDHDHSEAAVADACRLLMTLLRPEGIAVFHDFNDERNISEPRTYGVYAAVADLARQPGWRYLGMMGCCALVQRTTR